MRGGRARAAGSGRAGGGWRGRAGLRVASWPVRSQLRARAEVIGGAGDPRVGGKAWPRRGSGVDVGVGGGGGGRFGCGGEGWRSRLVGHATPSPSQPLAAVLWETLAAVWGGRGGEHGAAQWQTGAPLCKRRGPPPLLAGGC